MLDEATLAALERQALPRECPCGAARIGATACAQCGGRGYCNDVRLVGAALREAWMQLDIQGAEINRLCGLLHQAQAARDAWRAVARAAGGSLDLGPVADPWPAGGPKG